MNPSTFTKAFLFVLILAASVECTKDNDGEDDTKPGISGKGERIEVQPVPFFGASEEFWLFLSWKKANYDQAVIDCKSIGARLVIVDTQDKERLVESVIAARDETTSRTYFVGIFERRVNEEEERVFVWSNLAPVSKIFWCKDQPKNEANNCVVIEHGDSHHCLSDRSCNSEHYYICERICPSEN